MEEQIQAFVATMEELTRQNEELRLRSNNAPPKIEIREQQSNNEGNNRGKDNSDRTKGPSKMEEEFQNMKKQKDELNNVVKGKGERNLDRMIKQTASMFTAAVLDLPLSQKFRLPQLNLFGGSKDPLDHIKSFKILMN